MDLQIHAQHRAIAKETVNRMSFPQVNLVQDPSAEKNLSPPAELQADPVCGAPATDGLALLLGDEALHPSTLKPQGLNTLIPKSAKFVILAFSASHCKHCIEFIPKLVEASEKYLMPKLNTAVLLISNDHTEEAFNEYIGKKVQKLPALPWATTQAKKGIFLSAWGIQDFPHCVMLDRRTGRLVNSNVRFMVEVLGSVAVKPDAQEPAVLAARPNASNLQLSGDLQLKKDKEFLSNQLPADSLWRKDAKHAVDCLVDQGKRWSVSRCLKATFGRAFKNFNATAADESAQYVSLQEEEHKKLGEAGQLSAIVETVVAT